MASQLHIPVRVHKIKAGTTIKTAVIRQREHVGTIYFAEGTTANMVCEHLMRRFRTTSGLWLMQVKVKDPHNYPDVEDGCYVRVTDAKYILSEDKEYFALHYTAPPIFIH